MQANVGLGRNNYLHDKASKLKLDPIDENNSIQHLPSPVKLAPTPRRQLHPSGAPLHLQSTPCQDTKQQKESAYYSQNVATTLAPHDVMLDGPKNWTKGELIGQGAFGSVYLGMDNDSGQLMAVKQVTITPSQGTTPVAKRLAEHILSLEEEVHLLQSFHHPNIVRYLGTERTHDTFNIFLEYVPGGSIASLLAKFGSFKESVVKVYTKQILLGLEYLHAHKIIHRDIKVCHHMDAERFGSVHDFFCVLPPEIEYT